MTFKERLLFELTCLVKGVRNTKPAKITRKKVFSELISNGVAGLIALLSTKILGLFFYVPSIKNFFKFQERRSKIHMDQDTFSVLSWVMIFVVGLVVFTIVEQVMENYLKERDEKSANKLNP